MHRSRLFTSTVNVSLLRLAGQLIALVSGLVIANFFGASSATDDYYTALILPGTLANLIINSLTNLFAPIYMQRVAEEPEEGPKILSSMLFVVSLALLVGMLISAVAVLLYTAARPLSSDEAVTRALAFGFILVLNCPLIGYARLLGVYSESHQHYSGPAAAAILTPVMFIAVLLLTLPLGIYSLLIANLSSSAFELLILTIFVRRATQINLIPRLFIHPAVREMLRLSIAPAMAFLAMFFVPTIDRSMAASLDPGSLTTFHYGERLVIAFEALVLSGPLLVIYYHWANVNATQGIGAVEQSVPDMISLLNFIVVPLCVGGALLSYPIISILFGRGAFTAVDSSAHVFAVLLISEIAGFMIVIIVRLMLLIKKTFVQLVIGVGISFLNLAFNLVLITRWGLTGIVFSTLLTRIIIVIVAFFFCRHHFPNMRFRLLVARSAQTILCTLTMVAALALLNLFFSGALRRDLGLVWQIVSVGLVSLAGALVYTLVAVAIRHADFFALLQVIRQTLNRAPVQGVSLIED